MIDFTPNPIALAIGSLEIRWYGIAYVAARKVAMTDMPQMVAIYNGMGGGAAALIAANEFLHFGGSGLTLEMREFSLASLLWLTLVACAF